MELLNVARSDVRIGSPELGQHSTLKMDFGELLLMAWEVLLRGYRGDPVRWRRRTGIIFMLR